MRGSYLNSWAPGESWRNHFKGFKFRQLPQSDALWPTKPKEGRYTSDWIFKLGALIETKEVLSILAGNADDRELASLYILITNGNTFDRLILFHAVQTAFTTITTFFYATKRRLRGRNLAGIDTNHTDLQLLSDSHSTADISGEEIACQTKLCIICETQHVGFGLKLEDRSQGSECL